MSNKLPPAYRAEVASAQRYKVDANRKHRDATRVPASEGNMNVNSPMDKGTSNNLERPSNER